MQYTQEYIHNIVGKIKSFFFPSIYTKPGIRPARDWQVILVVFFVVTFVGVCVSIYIYGLVYTGMFWNKNTSEESMPIYTINQQKLTTVNDYFTQKQIHTTNGPKNISDPSF